MKRHIKINSGFAEVYYCKDFIALRDNNEQIVNEYIKSISTLKLENERLLYDYNKMKKEYETQKNS